MAKIVSPKKEFVNSPDQKSPLWRLVFFGTPDFADIILQALLKNPSYELVAVVTAPDHPKNRGQQIVPSPVKITAQNQSIKILQPERIKGDGKFAQELKSLEADVFLTAAYGQILPQEILAITRFGCLNVHGSLIPKYRGPSPINAVILNGEKKTGVSIILMNTKMDAGPIILKKEIAIAPQETAQTLHDKLADLGAAAALESLDLWLTAKNLPDEIVAPLRLEEQDESKATYTKILTKQDGQIDWGKDAVFVERQLRAFYPWPGSFSKVADKTFKIISADVLGTTDKKTGEIFLAANRLAVACGQGALLINQIQPEGKRVLTGQEFINGYGRLIGMVFE